MEKEISKYDFDIAIIGAGAYSLPLAAYVKQLARLQCRCPVLPRFYSVLRENAGSRFLKSRNSLMKTGFVRVKMKRLKGVLKWKEAATGNGNCKKTQIT